ncbi:MAG: translation initiation factor IF-2, partial [Nitrospirae bacterium]
MRVYELAKKLGMESRQLIPELVRMGIEVTSHSNALDEATAQRVLQAFQEDGRIDRRQEPLVSRKEKGSLYKKRTGQTEGGSRAKAAVEEAAPKPQRKRILIKRKKLEAEETAVPQSQIESVTAQAEAADSQAQAFVVPQEPKEAEPDTSVVPESIGSVESAEHLTASEVAAEELVTDSIGQEEVLQGPLPVSPETREEKIEAKEPPRKKELGSLVVDDLVEEKVKKPKKAGRLRDEDLFAARYEDAARWQDLRPLPTLRREERIRHHQPTAVTEITKPRKKGIKLEPGITVKAFAELLGQRPADIVKKLMDMGVLLTLNQPMNLDAASLIAADYGVTVEVVAEKAGEALLEEMQQEQKAGHLVPRA